MENSEINALDKMFEYNLWANTQLIQLCDTLTDDQLDVSVAGVFDRIQPTLVHIIRAEGGYLNRLTGKRPWADDLDWDRFSMAELLKKAQLSGQLLVENASLVDPAKRHVLEFEGRPFHFFNWSVLLQALYHGIEHRTQIKILLTKLGVEHPDWAAWDYMESSLPENQD